MDKETIDNIKSAVKIREKMFLYRRMIGGFVCLLLLVLLSIILYVAISGPSRAPDQYDGILFSIIAVCSISPFSLVIFSVVEHLTLKKSEKGMKGSLEKSEVKNLIESEENNFSEDEKDFVSIIFGFSSLRQI